MASSSSSSVAAAASFGNERNRVADRNPPLIPDGHAVYIDQLYLERRRHHELPLLCRTVAWGVLAFLAISCFVILVWLIFHPIFPNLRVASATISTVSVNATSVL